MVRFDFDTKERETLEALGIDALLLFGSHAQQTATPLSDIDVGVILPPGRIRSHQRRKEIYDTLYDLLSSHIRQLVTIDIVFLNGAPAELRSHVAKYGMLLYEKTPHSFARFREEVMDQYADFAPLRRLFHNEILARISP